MTPRPYIGMTFLHSRQITGFPKAGTSKPAVCVVTKVTKYAVYFRNESGYLSKVGPGKFAENVLVWVTTDTPAGYIGVSGPL